LQQCCSKFLNSGWDLTHLIFVSKLKRFNIRRIATRIIRPIYRDVLSNNSPSNGHYGIVLFKSL